MEYKLINLQTKEEHLCDKVTIDGFDYYVSDEEIKVGDWYTWDGNKNNAPSLCTDIYNESSILDSQGFTKFHKIIATNNPNIDIPKVVDEIYSYYQEDSFEVAVDGHSSLTTYVAGYNKSQETHPFSKDDVVEFKNWWLKLDIEWFDNTDDGNVYKFKNGKKVTDKELLQLWKEQQPKIVYYVD